MARNGFNEKEESVVDKEELINEILKSASELFGVEFEKNGKYKIRELSNKIHVLLQDYSIIKTGTQIIVSNQDWKFYATKFLACKKIDGLSPSTLRNYKSTLRMFFELIGNKPLEEITADDIRFFLADRMSKGSGKTNADNYRRFLSSFFSWCVDEELIDRNPIRKIKPLKKRKSERQPFSEIEIEQMRNYLRGRQGEARNRALIELLLSTGCRISEALNIKTEELNLMTGQVKVLGKGDKERIVFLNEKSKYYVEKYLEDKSRNPKCPYLFQSLQTAKGKKKNLQITGAEVAVRKMGRDLGISVFPHRFRHTAATWALQRGMPIEQVQKMLGHEKIDTTLIYAKSNIDDLATNHKKFMQ
ncbi:MAG: tyrosine-type recombinase/integrase [Eubacterium sp.]|nr:tyrosine-type recombinase/integrase [Eubacterium sp.]